jgi:hypothetical protein
VFVPSRVTLGADVAVTSIVLQKIERVFPQAECPCSAPLSWGSFFGDVEDGAIRRLSLRAARRPHRPARFVDPPWSRPSRRRCMGVIRENAWSSIRLPAHPTRSPSARRGTVPCFFFESRGYRRPGADTLGELTARWLDEIRSAQRRASYPQVAPTAPDWRHAQAVARQMRVLRGRSRDRGEPGASAATPVNESLDDSSGISSEPSSLMAAPS